MKVNKAQLLEYLRQIHPADYANHNVNLHIHSSCSDGIQEVREIVQSAIYRKKHAISITDHNTLSQNKEIESFKDYVAEKYGLNIIEGVELTTYDRGAMIHLLIYGVNSCDEKLRRLCKYAKFFAKRYGKLDTRKMVQTLSKDYVVVLAHPLVYKKIGLKHFIKSLSKLGLDGVEGFYPYYELDKMVEHNPFSTNKIYSTLAKIRAKLVNIPEIARQNNLIITGGLDTHGSNIDTSVGWGLFLMNIAKL